MIVADSNHAAYSKPSLVRYYSQIHQLQPAEQAILQRFQERLPTMAVLDLGIGGGRTTQYLLPQAGQYTGIDYSAEMVAACRQRFSQSSATFAVMDARDLSAFADNSFDLIWFSFNGLDYVSHDDRLRILQEVGRVGRSGAYFVFSSHNLRGMVPVFNLRQHLSLKPVKTYVDVAMWGLLRWFNRGLTPADLKSADHLILRDESHNFALKTYYIDPAAQIQQLAMGFHSVEVYPWTQRTPVDNLNHPALADPLWLYYCCQVA